MIRFRGARTTVRDRVISMASKWMALEEPLCGQPAAFEGTMEADGLRGVIGTGRVEAAASARGEGVKNGGKGVLIEEKDSQKKGLKEPDKAPQEWLQRFHDCREEREGRVFRKRASRSSNRTLLMRARAISRRSQAGGRAS